MIADESDGIEHGGIEHSVCVSASVGVGGCWRQHGGIVGGIYEAVAPLEKWPMLPEFSALFSARARLGIRHHAAIVLMLSMLSASSCGQPAMSRLLGDEHDESTVIARLVATCGSFHLPRLVRLEVLPVRLMQVGQRLLVLRVLLLNFGTRHHLVSRGAAWPRHQGQRARGGGGGGGGGRLALVGVGWLEASPTCLGWWYCWADGVCPLSGRFPCGSAAAALTAPAGSCCF